MPVVPPSRRGNRAWSGTADRDALSASRQVDLPGASWRRRSIAKGCPEVPGYGVCRAAAASGLPGPGDEEPLCVRDQQHNVGGPDDCGYIQIAVADRAVFQVDQAASESEALRGPGTREFRRRRRPRGGTRTITWSSSRGERGVGGHGFPSTAGAVRESTTFPREASSRSAEPPSAAPDCRCGRTFQCAPTSRAAADCGPMRQYYVRRVRRPRDDEQNDHEADDHEADGRSPRVLRRPATSPGVWGRDPEARDRSAPDLRDDERASSCRWMVLASMPVASEYFHAPARAPTAIRSRLPARRHGRRRSSAADLPMRHLDDGRSVEEALAQEREHLRAMPVHLLLIPVVVHEADPVERLHGRRDRQQSPVLPQSTIRCCSRASGDPSPLRTDAGHLDSSSAIATRVVRLESCDADPLAARLTHPPAGVCRLFHDARAPGPDLAGKWSRSVGPRSRGPGGAEGPSPSRGSRRPSSCRRRRRRPGYRYRRRSTSCRPDSRP